MIFCRDIIQHTLNHKHVARRCTYKLYTALPYTVNVAIFVHLVNVRNQSFIEQKLLIILQQSGILGTEFVTCNILVKCPKTPIFLPPVNDNKKLTCVRVCVCVIKGFFIFSYFSFKNILTLKSQHLVGFTLFIGHEGP
jgi:hypothetical protein